MDEKNLNLKAAEAQGGGGMPRWIPGLVLVAVGTAVFLNQAGVGGFDNWWALFLLVPVLGFVASAWQDVRTHGRLTAGGRKALLGAAFTGIIPAAFLVGVSIGAVWPLFFIVAGLAAMLNGVRD